MARGKPGKVGVVDDSGLALTRESIPTTTIADTVNNSAKITGRVDLNNISSRHSNRQALLFIIWSDATDLNLRKNRRLRVQNVHKI